MSTAQERADQAAKDLMTAVAEMAVKGDSEIVVLMRGSIADSTDTDATMFYSWEWFCRPEDRAPEAAAAAQEDPAPPES